MSRPSAARQKFWLEPRHRDTGTWTADRDINNLMLATSLVPEGFLKRRAHMSAATTPHPNPRDLLIADHELLEKTFQEPIRGQGTRPRASPRDAWTRLENLLFAHMAAEETHVFPFLREGQSR